MIIIMNGKLMQNWMRENILYIKATRSTNIVEKYLPIMQGQRDYLKFSSNSSH